MQHAGRACCCSAAESVTYLRVIGLGARGSSSADNGSVGVFTVRVNASTSVPKPPASFPRAAQS
jgi:hypothetical protein